MITEILCLFLGLCVGFIISNYFNPLTRSYTARFSDYQKYISESDEENRRLRQRLNVRINREEREEEEQQQEMQLEAMISQIPDAEIEKNLEKFGLKGVNASMAKPLIAEFLKSQIK